MKYTGTVLHIGFTEQVTDKFSKRIIVVSDKTEKYPQEVAFEFNNDSTDLLDNFAIGSMVDIEFNLRGRKWTNKEQKDVWFNTLQGWKISRVQVSNGSAPHENLQDYQQQDNAGGDNDDSPF